MARAIRMRKPLPVVDIPAPDPLAPLYERAAMQIPRIAEQVLEAFFARSAAYRQLPHQLVDREITEAVTRNLQVFLRSLREQRPPAPEELAAQIATAVRRAQQGIPLDVVLSTYHVAAHVGWTAMAGVAEKDDIDDLLATVPALLQYLSFAVPAVAASYLTEQQALHAERREAGRALVAALLTGREAEPLAERIGLDLASHHVVLAVRVEPPPLNEGADGHDARLAAHVLVRRLRAELPKHALSALDHDGGTVLLPTSAETVDAELADAADLVRRLHTAAGLGLVGGIAAAESRDDIPTAARQAADIAELAQRLGRPSGAYVLDDVLLEYQLCRPGPGRKRLARVMDRLAEHPDLLHTLREFINSDHNRHRTAEKLHLHRNTLNYRLRRVTELTGYNPADPGDIRLLAASLIVHDLRP
ncbi:PucR-like helix-turn-helix protein [Lentzea atacamensis]|uniref:PucR-like helix-turn-helix protein n=2 Tax=Lentzea TaxID=165301 RepID=A0ABX9EA73_9PSEU|nr:helix-turn-helix domain-containing protein [Lentzea atacamensis]RAS65084.1 PucR-like helix-turn-helix protein [Lentzea atacamensis]